jgi:PhnB protein
MAQLSPYLSFNDNCREAMNFYKDCLGGELTFTTVGETPMSQQMPPNLKDAILHSSLVQNGITIMGSDMRKDELSDGNTVKLCVNCKSEEEINSFFSKLSAGGQITQPLADMPFGSKFGSLTDKYGKLWLFEYALTKKK